MKATKGQYLLLFRLVSRRLRNGLLVLLLLLIAVAIIEGVMGLAGVGRIILWLLTMLVLFSWLYFAVFLPRASIQVLENSIQFNIPLRRLSIPLNLVESVEASRISDHYRYNDLSYATLELLDPIYNHPCLQIMLRSFPDSWHWRQLLLPKLFFTKQGAGILVAVDDLPSLNAELSRAVSRQRKRPKNRQVRESNLSKNGHRKMPANAPQNPIGGTPPLIVTDSDDKSDPIILIAEAEIPSQKLLTSYLKDQYRLVIAGTGTDALRKAQIITPDLIICNFHLPQMNGLQLLDAVRNLEELKKVPILYLIPENDDQSRLIALKAGGNDYVYKPCDKIELITRVNNLLRVRQQELDLLSLNQRLEARIKEQGSQLVVSGNLQRFMPKAVVESVKAGHIGEIEVFERRIVTVMFTDIVGFTPITERLNPDKLASVLNDYLREMTGLTVLYGGTVDKFIGDALMILFGAPEVSSPVDQARAAIQTAMALRHQMKHLSERWYDTTGQEFKMRIGINTGPCTVGVFGSDILKSYTAIGSTVNVASRLEGVARPNGILCSRPTYELVKGMVRAKVRGKISLKGIQEPVEAFDIVGMRQEKQVELA